MGRRDSNFNWQPFDRKAIAEILRWPSVVSTDTMREIYKRKTRCDNSG